MHGEGTRLLFLGDATLARGFRLAGFEVHPDIDVAGMEDILRGLQKGRRRAFVILDSELSAADSKVLEELRSEGGRVLLAEVPPVSGETATHSPMDEAIARLLGNGA